jgi:hypothetical protein
VYEESFGTDWEELGRDDVLRRAFALGVAEGLGSAPEGELERLQEQVSGRYGRSMVELAYDEGRTRGRKPGPADEEEVWQELVEGGSAALQAPTRPTPPRPPRQTDLPKSISAPTLLDISRDDLARLGLPDFLR